MVMRFRRRENYQLATSILFLRYLPANPVEWRSVRAPCLRASTAPPTGGKFFQERLPRYEQLQPISCINEKD